MSIAQNQAIAPSIATIGPRVKRAQKNHLMAPITRAQEKLPIINNKKAMMVLAIAAIAGISHLIG